MTGYERAEIEARVIALINELDQGGDSEEKEDNRRRVYRA